MIDSNDMLSTALQEAFNMESDESFPTIDEGKIINIISITPILIKSNIIPIT